jgi:hypothetical protein
MRWSLKKLAITQTATLSTSAMSVRVAIYCTLFLLCRTSFSSDIAHSADRVTLVAPLYITNDHFMSQVTLTNTGDGTVETLVIFDSLEGEEVARKSMALPARSSMSIDLDSVPMTQHRFAPLGSISISAASPSENDLIGRVSIVSRTGTDHIEETLQPADEKLRSLQVGFVPASFSVPLLAIHSMSELPQRISVICFESRRGSYESQLVLPGRMTFLVNACVSERSESRTYEQLLSGDAGAKKGDMTIKIKAADVQGAFSVWGFATASKGAELGPQIVGIEFVEWDPGIEFLLELGP